MIGPTMRKTFPLELIWSTLMRSSTMKNKNQYMLFYALISFSIVCACSTGQPKIPEDLETSFQNQVRISDMNSSMIIKSLGSAQNRFGADIDILIVNTTHYQISLPPNLGNEMFVVRNGQWIQIINPIQYSGNVTLLPSNSGGFDYEFPGTVRAVLNSGMNINAQEPEILRIFVAGKLIKNGIQPSVSVGAYLDTFIAP
jgi:hypothetical protein